MSIAAAHLWHKPSERAAWMRRFVIVSDSAIRIYGTRNDHEQHAEAMYYIELLTTTDLLNGSDNIVYQGWLEKKGKVLWNARWCALVKYGYLNYIDPEQKQGIRSIDISNVKFILEKSRNLIQWKNDTGEWFQFRCDSPSIQSRWHSEMLEIQKNCIKIRIDSETNHSLNKEPTLFAFIVRKAVNRFEKTISNLSDIKSNRYQQHYFCADNDQYLEGWKKCIIEQIAHCNDDKNAVNQQSKFLRNKLAEHRKRSYNINSSENTLREYHTPRLYHNSKGSITSIATAADNEQKYIGRSRQISLDWIDYKKISDKEIDHRMQELMNNLKIPKHARSNMLRLNKKQKIKMLEQHHIKQQLKKQHESGRIWSDKFAAHNSEGGTNKVNISTLQQFSVVLRDETDQFVKDFIQNLGLNRLCHLATKSLQHNGSSQQRGKSYFGQFDIELLRVLKAIIDANEYSLKQIVEHNLCIRIIADKIDSQDIKISELALSLLITMVGIENDEISISASKKILSALSDLALSKGQRNKYKVLISHMSVKDVLNGSFQYDTYSISLLNYLIMSLPHLHLRMDERRLLNSLQFDKILNKLQDRIRIHSNEYYNHALLNQIETYRKLYETDKRNANQNEFVDAEWDMMNDFDIDNPKDLFKRLHDQCLNDAYINELTSILKNLVVLPSSAENVWYNVTKIVNAACKPIQNQMLYPQKAKAAETETESKLNSVVEGEIKTQNFDENYIKLESRFVYPTYKELRTMLEIREATNMTLSDTRSNANASLQNELNQAREKQLKLEDALLCEKSKSLNLESQLQHLFKYGTSSQTNPLAKTSSNKSNNSNSLSNSSYIVVEAEADNEDKKEAEIVKTKQEIAAKVVTVTVTDSAAAIAKTVAVDDGLNKYRKMIKFKMPKNSIVNRMRQDGIDKNIIEQYTELDTLPGGNAKKPQTAGKDPKAAMLAMIASKSKSKTAKISTSSDDEEKLKKYRKMLKINLPKQSVINRMRQDEMAPNLIGILFPDAVEAKQSEGDTGNNGNILSALKRKKKKKAAPKLPSNLRPKKLIKPKNKMRNLHWTTVNPFDVEKTIWNSIDDEEIEFDVSDLESKFCWKQSEKDNNEKIEKSKVKLKMKSDIVRVLDTRRSYNIEIFLGRLKSDPWTLREAMLSLNESRLNLDTVHKLINFVPTKDECLQLDGYENEKNLGVAENFVKIIRNVDGDLRERLILWEFKMEFNDLYEHEKQQLIFLRKGHDSIKKSGDLRQIFCIILSIGNYMNGSTNKGQAYGFKLSSLSQLMRSRTVDNSCTLMEYLYQFVSASQRYRHCLQFVDGLACLEDTCCVDIAVLRQNIAGIGHKLKRIKKRMDSYSNPAGSAMHRMGDNFYAVMQPFYVCAILKLELLQKVRDEMFTDLKDLGVWLNEAKDANFKYLKTLNQFRLNFIQIIKVSKMKKEKLARIEKRKKWKENKLKIKNKKIKKIIITKKKKEKKETEFLTEKKEKKKKKKKEEKNTNISDVVIQTLVDGTSYNFIQRLQDRNKSASKSSHSRSKTALM